MPEFPSDAVTRLVNEPTVQHIEVLIKDGSYTLDQMMYLGSTTDWQMVRTCDEAPGADLEPHGFTMCDECIGEWALDYWIRVVTDVGHISINSVPGYVADWGWTS